MRRLLLLLLTLLFSLSGLAMGGYSDFRQSSDLVNAGISAGRGDFVGAGFNLASSLPGLGDAFAAGKIATAAVGVAVAKSASHAVSSTAATAAKVEAAVVKETTTVFRQGTFADEAIGWEGNFIKGKQWATDNPLTTPNYAQKYGLPAENTAKPDWIVGGRIQSGQLTTRPAPASHNNPFNTGGATEVLPNNPNNVQLDWFHMPD